ncbi:MULTISPECIES: AI-2E family transporter [Ensifer]|uniref:AI-2E family transporter n=1 Tax=Ensifer TaxID=106591 RepID=UPI000714A6F2|nr:MULTISPECIES: AI-2E family transporter [Ensifer]KQX45013.1 ABC transporter permease [Ensifer sp. Root1298]KQX76855.1 ABC transporter permease [Ensifer sp. Root1312]KRC26283.1 ABC transporter permease [Ensifer sp. Root74]KRD60144.1 ABC transporter permease [Ensifer sp. Root954]MBD9544140.1 AI-2E family transporter [Ensifer sp. ENS04]
MLRFSRKSGKEPVNMAVELHPLTLSRAAAETSKLPTLAAIAATVAVLYIARDVFLPLAIAILLTFALAPVVSRLRRAGCPRSVAVIGTVTMAFLFLSAFGAMVALQISEVARDVPRYQSNIVEKVRSLKEAGSDSQILDRLSRVMERISIELSRPEKDVAVSPATAPEPKPLLVEIFSPQRPIEILMSVINPLLGPLATAGLVIVVVIFMLFEREDLRDRFIRLVGYGDLHRTTEALQDAGARVGQYLLMQLVVNITYGVPLAIGLWFLGIPNALLWGMLAIMLRFVPYIGPVIAAALPLFLAFAAAPGWSLVVLTLGLFIALELLSNNVVEPLLYGSRTGLSPLAIIVAAIFWAWLWGPVGLVLSTPLTVCLVVLGRHVRQFEFLEILLGNEPVLNPKERLYQRLLAGDPDEATDNAEEMLEEMYLVEFYDTVAIPALLLAESDRMRGALTEEQGARVAESAGTLVANLEEIAVEEEDEDKDKDKDKSEDPDRDTDEKENDYELPPGEGRSVLCLGGRSALDDVTAMMLLQVLRVQGADVNYFSHEALRPQKIKELPTEGRHAIVLTVLDRESMRHAKFLVRRLKRLAPGARVGIVLWQDVDEHEAGKFLVEETQADFVVSAITDAIREALSTEPPQPFKSAHPGSAGRAAVRGPAHGG